MLLRKLVLLNFKNYESKTLELGAGVNCFVGRNGVGKTNLLDAIHYLCLCRSRFSLSDKELVRHEDTFFRLDGFFQLDQGHPRPNDVAREVRITAKIVARKKKEFLNNDVAYEKLSEHIGLLPAVMITPDDTNLATGGSEERRAFLDATLSQTDATYLQRLIVYNRALEQRNAALKQFAERGFFNNDLLQTYDELLVPAGEYIHEARKRFLEGFDTLFKEIYAAISGGAEQVHFDYESQLLTANFAQLLQSAREKDRILMRTTVGIHRDNLDLLLGGYELKRYGSQGQVKSYVLAMRLAQYEMIRQEKGVSPILLLDDIFDKLDASRVRRLLELLIARKFGQIFITDTHQDRVWKIVEGLGVETANQVVLV